MVTYYRNDIDEQRMLEIARYELANGVYTLVTEGISIR